MINIVLFLLAVLLVTVIIKLLKLGKRTVKVIGSILLIIVVLCAVGFAVIAYNENQEITAYIEKLKAYSTTIDEYAETRGYTVGNILSDSSGKFDEEAKAYFRAHEKELDPTKKVTMISDVVAFANTYRSANGISTGRAYIDVVSGEKTTLHLERPLKGQADIVIVFYPYFIDSWDTKKLVQNGVYDAWLFKIYNLDGTKIFSLRNGWSLSTEHNAEMFDNAKDN